MLIILFGRYSLAVAVATRPAVGDAGTGTVAFASLSSPLMCTWTSPLTCYSLRPPAHADYMVHTHVKMDDIGGVVITDLEYPKRVAYSLILKV